MRGWVITTSTTKQPGFKTALWLLQCGLSLFLLLATSSVSALGLGKIKVRSALNEPLNAEIHVVSISRSERKTLKVRIASTLEFATAGVDRPFYLTNIKFTLAKRLDGTYFIQMRTHESVREPFIHFLVHLEWAGGQLNREYSALIDPPYLAAGKPAAIETPKTAATTGTVSQAKTTDTKPVAKAKPKVDEKPKSITLATSKEPEPTGSRVERLADKPGDTVDRTKTDSAKTTDSTTEAIVSVGDDVGVGGLGDDGSADSTSSTVTTPAKFRTDDMGWPIHDQDPDVEKKSGGSTAVTKISSSDRYYGWAKMSRYRVKRGDMMWNIAKRVRGDSSLSLEQVVLAIYQNNRGAFFDNNVNNLSAGKILQIPDRDDILRLSRKKARSRFFAQYNVWQEHQLRVAQAKQTIKVSQDTATDTKPVATAKPKVDKKPVTKVADTKKPVVVDTKKPVAKKPDVKAKTKTVAKADKVMTKPVKKADKKPVKTDKPKTDVTPKVDGKKSVTTVAKKAAPKKQAVVVAKKQSVPKNLLQIVRNTLKRDQKGAPATADSTSLAKEKEKEKAAMLARADKIGENIDATGMKTKEIGDKATAVQKQIKNQERLITIEDGNLAKGDKIKETPKVADSKVVAKDSKADAKKTDAKKADDKTPVTTAKTTDASKTKDVAKTDTVAKVAKPVVTKTTSAKPVVKSTVKKPRIKVTPVKPEKSIFQSILDDLLANRFMLYILGGAVVLFLAIAGMLMYRRKRSIAEFHESILNTGDATTDSSTALDSEGHAISTGDTSFLSDFSQGGMGNIHTDEVDPVAEAEVYLAYGRDEQAEEILKEAIVKSPERHELKVKLLEIYHQRNDVSSFETLAEELYAALEGRAGAPWDKVEEMGRKLNPENPMFRGGRPASMAAPPTGLNQPETDASSLFTGTDEPSVAATAIMGSTQETEAFSGLTEDVSAEEGAGVEFDLNFDSAGGTPAAAEEQPQEISGIEFDGIVETPSDEDSSLEFDLSGEAGDDETPSGEIVEEDFSLSFGEDETSIAADSGADAEIEWDVGGDDGESGDLDIDETAGVALGTATETSTSTDTQAEEGQVQQWDETATKLDLAKAYIDMGDAEGARSILDEVMAEGSDSQKKQAAELAAQIS